MFRKFFVAFLCCALSILYVVDSKEPPLPGIYHYQEAVSDDVWVEVAPFLLPAQDPVKLKLDKIFKKRRAIADTTSLEKAGFEIVAKQKWTRLVVVKHKKVPGFIFKLYMDRQHYHRGKPEHYFWIRRCKGARLIQEEIDNNQWQDIFKVPRKWIYPLPPHPAPSGEGPAKYFILVEDDMDIYPSMHNYRLWGSKFVTKKKLDALFALVQKLGLWDCAKPDNAPISKDNKIAFVDTQTFHRWPVAFEKLTKYLNAEMAAYWEKITR
jgi:hypothetical protein